MPRFFCEPPAGGRAVITGDDARHLSRVLRRGVGDVLTLCDLQGRDYDARISAISPEMVECSILASRASEAEPRVAVHLYQSYPKKDKFETIVQKSVELGAGRITPVFSHRCVSRPDDRAMQKNIERARRVALEAAKQSGRGRLPQVGSPLDFAAALEASRECELRILFYEEGGLPLAELLPRAPAGIAIFVGPEGGYEPGEVQRAQADGVQICTLGPRILRCETAPLAALAAVMYATGNLS